jgi:hypothetical protein
MTGTHWYYTCFGCKHMQGVQRRHPEGNVTIYCPCGWTYRLIWTRDSKEPTVQAHYDPDRDLGMRR